MKIAIYPDRYDSAQAAKDANELQGIPPQHSWIYTYEILSLIDDILKAADYHLVVTTDDFKIYVDCQDDFLQPYVPSTFWETHTQCTQIFSDASPQEKLEALRKKRAATEAVQKQNLMDAIQRHTDGVRQSWIRFETEETKLLEEIEANEN